MKQVFSNVLVLACFLAASPLLYAQAPAPGTAQNEPAPSAPKSSQPQESNPFPEDTTKIPVMPTASSPAAPEPASHPEDNANIRLPGDDLDPVRSPEDSGPEPTVTQHGESSSSSGFSDLEKLLEPPPETGKQRKHAEEAPVRRVGPKEDISVGNYYMQTKNWRGALSRFESALVLAPENPDVYWGLAECQYHLGNYSAAKGNYLKVIEYDPDSRHSKDAKKALKQPELANAPAVSSNAPATQPQQQNDQ